MSERRRRWFRWLACSVAAMVAAVLVAQWACRMRMEALEAPFTVQETVAMPDGGTMWLALQDAKGHTIWLWRRGSLEVPAAAQPFYVSCMFGPLPMPCHAPKGSPLEVHARQALKTLLDGRLTSAQKEALVVGGADDLLKTVPGDVLGTWALLHWIERRETAGTP